MCPTYFIRAGALFAFVALTACSSNETTDPRRLLPRGSPTVRGTVVEIASGNGWRFLTQRSSENSQLWIRVSEESVVLSSSGSRVSPQAIRPGAQISAWISTGFLPSNPGVAFADTLVVER
jgi:hypothetical protein